MDSIFYPGLPRMQLQSA